MNATNKIPAAAFFLSLITTPAWAAVTVNSPVANTDVTSPFAISATATACGSKPVVKIGFALDSSPDTTMVVGTEIESTVAATAGAHIVHVQAWTEDGASCVTDVALTVTPANSGPVIPGNAVSVSNIQAMSKWKGQHDTGGNGSSSGSTVLVNSPSQSGTARTFITTYKDAGDERYSVSFADDAESTNFVYDAWVFFNKTGALVGNLEMDLNQVMPNGDNAIFAFQCAGSTNTWDYTANSGTPKKSKVQWVRSKQYCNPGKWAINVWHHVQIQYSRDENGNITYQSVWLDGNQQVINATVPAMFALGWGAGILQTQFQVDGIGKSGKTSVYLDNLTVYRW